MRNTKKGDRYGSFNLEDKSGFIEVIVWPEAYKKCAELLGADDPIYVKGKMEVGEERMQVIANEITPLAEAAKNPKNAVAQNQRTEKIISTCAKTKYPPMSWSDCATRCSTIPGASTVFLHLRAPANGETVIELPEQVRIAPSPELEDMVGRIFGQRISFHSLRS